MSSFRYTLDGNYDQAKSQDAQFPYGGDPNDPNTNDLESTGVYYSGIQGGMHSLVLDVQGNVLYSQTAGILVDFADKTISVRLTSGSVGDVLRSGSGNDILNGADGDDVVEGGAGSDTLNGGAGIDTLSYEHSSVRVYVDLLHNVVGNGDAAGDSISGFENVRGSAYADAIYVDGLGANVVEGGAGADFIQGDGAEDTASYEHSLTGVTVSLARGAAAQIGAGDASGDILSGISHLLGSAYADSLTGDGNVNTLDGGSAGADGLAGGAGDDTYIVNHAGVSIIEADNAGLDMVLAGIDYTLAINVENLELTGAADLSGTGNALANTLTGNSGNNTLFGGDGNDRLFGGAGFDGLIGGLGNDILDGGDDVDVLYGQAGNDQLFGGLGDDVIEGGAGNDRLDGGTGADMMLAGSGNDTYVVDDAGDTVREDTDDGSDTGGLDTVEASISFTLGAFVENLVLTGTSAINGTGNALANTITGNVAANILDGGSAGNDRLLGGAGDDSYIVNRGGITVVEAADGGVDTVLSSTNAALAANVENLVLTGTGGNGTGNAGANTLTGNAGNNVLDGRAGVDTMTGGGGNDTYYVDNPGDVVVELTGEGNDVVRAAISYTLGENVETLILTGASNVTGMGNGLNNLITGGTGNNQLAGLGGRDTLTGGAGADTFIFRELIDSTVATSGRDTINDFSQAQTDRIDLRGIDANSFLDGNQAFGFIGTGAFTSTVGQLRYEASGTNTLVTGDVDGNGGADFAILLNGQITLQRGDFLL